MADRLAEIARDAALTFGGRATRRDTIHLTLAFLGNVPEARLPDLSIAATTVAVAPFAISLDRLGFWSHNHLLWAGCETPAGPLDALFGQLRRALTQAGFRVGAEGRDFTPHVTLVRHVPEPSAPTESRPVPQIAPIFWGCQCFALVRSTLSALGPEYEIIDEFPLVATKAP